MKNKVLKSASLLVVLLVLFASLLQIGAAPPKDLPRDPLEGAFFPPELVLLAGGRIGLSPEQREEVQRAVEKVQARSEEFLQRLKRESAALAALAGQDRLDEAAVLAQLDKLLDAERQAKRLHIGLLARVKSLLTPAQQEKLREFSKDDGAKLAEETRQRLAEKGERIQQGAQTLAEGGKDPSAIAQAMQEEFKPLLDSGKISGAEAVLDRLLKELESLERK